MYIMPKQILYDDDLTTLFAEVEARPADRGAEEVIVRGPGVQNCQV